MDREKRQQNSNTGNRKKLRRLATDKNRYLVTHFDDLSNEIIYEIFEFLDSYDIYKGFFDLNIRFRHLCIHSNLPLKINNLSLSKSTFENYYTYFIKPNKHRIQSLHLSDPFTIDFFSSSTEDISKCSQLQTLILEDIESQCLKDLLNRLTSLPNLSSLAIHIGKDSSKMNIYNLIFQLPVLKYCKISLAKNISLGPLPMSTQTSSPIEHLVISGKCYLKELGTFLSYVPRLYRLSIKCVYQIMNERIENCSFGLNNLISVSLELAEVNFENFQQFAKNHFHQVQVLYISTRNGNGFSDAKQWEKLILSHIPYLRIFDLQGGSHRSYVVLTHKESDSPLYAFKSPFWLERQWLFACEIYYNMQTASLLMLYSTRPYRRKYFTLSQNQYANKDTFDENVIFNSVRHIIIEDEQVPNKCLKYFPSAHELTLNIYGGYISECIASGDFQRTIPLTQLTKLTLNRGFYIITILHILSVIPNIHTLIFCSILLVEKDFYTIDKTELFRLVSSENKIKNVTITDDYLLKKIKVFSKLCPQLEHLTIGTSQKSLEGTVRFFLSEDKKTTGHLSSLCIFGVNKMWIERLKTIIESKMVSDDYSIKVVDSKFYVWW